MSVIALHHFRLSNALSACLTTSNAFPPGRYRQPVQTVDSLDKSAANETQYVPSAEGPTC